MTLHGYNESLGGDFAGPRRDALFSGRIPDFPEQCVV